MSLALSVLLASTIATASASPSATPPSLQTHACTFGASHASAVCGTLTVYENRALNSGRTIPLNFVLIEAKHPTHHAIAFNPGGPGASAADAAGGFADATGAIGAMRERYDILLLDNRGTGKSAPQQCNFAPPAHPELYFKQLWPDEIVKTCREKLAANADLSEYTTTNSADDLDDVRAALGYDKLTLFGGSYGTFFYLAYARQHPDRVEREVLEGVAAPHFYIIPVPMARGAQTSLDNLIAACNADAACKKHFPAFKAHFDALSSRFDAGPVTMSVENSITHRPQSVGLSKEVFVETVRHALYNPADAEFLPVIVERAYNKDYRALASMVDQQAQLFTNEQATGLNLSVTCAEDIPFITEDAVAKAVAGTFEGALRVRAQQRACDIWNVRPVPASFIEPVKSDAPMLMISGTDDPATPPVYAQQALEFLPNARLILVQGASHQSEDPPCVEKAIQGFVLTQTLPADLTKCAAAYHRPSFAMLTYYEPAPGENPSLTARFRHMLIEMMAGRIDRSQITAALSKQFSEPVLKEFASEVAGAGDLQTFVYRTTSTSPKGKNYVYLVHFAQATVPVTITVNRDGKIGAFEVGG